MFETTGHVGAGLHVLGTTHFPSYLVDSDQPVLIDCCVTCLGEIYRRDIEDTLNGRHPARLFLTHAHFDHCGAAGYLKAAFPEMDIAASEKAASIVQRPNAVKLITRLNRETTGMLESFAVPGLLDEDFRPFEINTVLTDGQTLNLTDDLSVQVFASPGHTWDFMTYYFPERKILIGSEAVGCIQHNGSIMADCLVDFETFIQSMDRLSRLEIDYLAQGHYCVHVGDEIPEFFRRSRQSALELQARVRHYWQTEDGVLARVMDEVRAWEYDPIPEPKQQQSAYLINLLHRVKAAGKGLEFTGPPSEMR